MSDYNVNLNEMTIEEIQAYIAAMQAEVNTAGCSRCAANKYNAKIRTARRQVTRLQRNQIIADAQAAQAAREPAWEHPS